MPAHRVVKENVDLAKCIFDELLEQKDRSGQVAFELDYVLELLAIEGIQFDNVDLSSAIGSLIARGFVRLNLDIVTAKSGYFRIRLIWTGKTTDYPR